MTKLDDVCQRILERAWAARSSDGHWRSAWFFIVGSNGVIPLDALFPASRYERTNEPEFVASTVRAIRAKGAVFVTDTWLQAIDPDGPGIFGAGLPHQALVLTLLDPARGSGTWLRVYQSEDGKPSILCDARRNEIIMANDFLAPVMAALREQCQPK